MTEPNEIEFHDRVPAPSGRSTVVRIGMVAGAVVLVAVGVVAVMAASPSSATGADPSASAAPAATTPAATAGPQSSAAPGTVDPRSGKLPRVGFGVPFGPGRDGAMGLGGFRGVTITSISGSDISLKTDDGWTRTIEVGSTTKITKGGAAIKVGDLSVGDQIHFAQDRASDGTYDVTAIVVVLPTIAGKVTAIDGNTLTVTQLGGATATIHVDRGTTYRIDGATGSLSGVKVGSFIVAEGTQRSDGSLDAAAVQSGLRGPGMRGHDGTTPKADPKASPAPSSGAG